MSVVAAGAAAGGKPPATLIPACRQPPALHELHVPRDQAVLRVLHVRAFLHVLRGGKLFFMPFVVRITSCASW
jgi:hypothetical protein